MAPSSASAYQTISKEIPNIWSQRETTKSPHLKGQFNAFAQNFMEKNNMMHNPSVTVKFGNNTVRPQTAAPVILNPEEI